MGIFSRFAADYVTSSQLNFVRGLVGLLILIYLQFKGYSLKSQRKKFLFLRGVIAGTASIAFFKAIMAKVTLATATTLLFSYPIFATILSWIVLQERLSVREIIMVFLAFIGIAIILQPQRAFIEGEWWALLAAICAGSGVVLLRWLRIKETTFSIYFYHCLSVMVITLPGIIHLSFSAIFFSWPFVLGFAVAGVTGQLLMNYGYKFCKVTLGGVVGMTEVLFSVIWGIIIFNEKLRSNLFLGGALVLGSGIYLLRESSFSS